MFFFDIVSYIHKSIKSNAEKLSVSGQLFIGQMNKHTHTGVSNGQSDMQNMNKSLTNTFTKGFVIRKEENGSNIGQSSRTKFLFDLCVNPLDVRPTTTHTNSHIRSESEDNKNRNNG